jgi:hypothetical protein
VSHLKVEISDKAFRMAENAAARVAKYAIKAGAPIGESGKLSSSITISRERERGLISHGRVPVRVGPSQKAYYGYFLERGWTPTGSVRKEKAVSGDFTYRPGSKWFSEAIERTEQQIIDAAEKSFTQAVRRMTR